MSSNYCQLQTQSSFKKIKDFHSPQHTISYFAYMMNQILSKKCSNPCPFHFKVIRVWKNHNVEKSVWLQWFTGFMQHTILRDTWVCCWNSTGGILLLMHTDITHIMYSSLSWFCLFWKFRSTIDGWIVVLFCSKVF